MTTNEYASAWPRSENDSCYSSNGIWRLSIHIAFLGVLTIHPKQVTCSSVISFRLQGNNVLFYGYKRKMAPGQTKLSIFNVPACMCMNVCRKRHENETSQTFFFLSPTASSLLWWIISALKTSVCRGQIQNWDHRLYPCRHVKLAFSDTEFCSFLCVLTESMNMHLIPVWLQIADFKKRLVFADSLKLPQFCWSVS